MRSIRNDGGTISEACGFELQYLHSTPTTNSSTGTRWYTGIENGKSVLVYHTNGTPSNSSTTTIYFPHEVKQHFAWDWDNLDNFSAVKKWVENILAEAGE